MLYGSKTWCLTDKEVAILKTVKRAMFRAISGVKQMDRKNTGELMTILGLTVSMEMAAKAIHRDSFGTC